MICIVINFDLIETESYIFLNRPCHRHQQNWFDMQSKVSLLLIFAKNWPKIQEKIKEISRSVGSQYRLHLLHALVKRQQSYYFEYIKENDNDGEVICQVDYSENFTLVSQNQIQSAHWSNQQVSTFTAYAWMSNSSGGGYSFSFVADSAKHDKSLLLLV